MSGLAWGLYHLEKLKNLWKYSKTSKTDPNIFQSSTTGWIGVFARPFLGPRTLCLTPLLYTVTQEVVWTQNLVWGVKAKRCTMLLPFKPKHPSCIRFQIWTSAWTKACAAVGGVSTPRAPTGATASKATNSHQTMFAKVYVSQKIGQTLFTPHVKVTSLWVVLHRAVVEALQYRWRFI